jgi:putative ABC transport system permease protein
MFYVALRMLLGDKSKSLILICALSFATLLMSQQTAIFYGILRWSSSILRNTKGTIWVVDPNTQQVNEVLNMRDIELQRVRSCSGVEWAMPICIATLQARMESGYFKPIQLIGLDSTTLAGHPKNIDEGSILDLLQAKTVMIDRVAIDKLSVDWRQPIGLGTYFQINDRGARVVAICTTDRSFFGYPFIYTTYSEATKYIPPQRKLLSYVIAQPKPGLTPREVADQIHEQTGLKAYLEDEFTRATIWWFFLNTGIPITFSTTVVLGFIVGIAIAGQTFYAFILENISNYCVLVAMGATHKMLYRMMVAQAATVGLMGYGFGLGITGLFGRVVMKIGQPPFYLRSDILYITFFAIFFICYVSVVIAGRRLKEIEPAQVFRG